MAKRFPIIEALVGFYRRATGCDRTGGPLSQSRQVAVKSFTGLEPLEPRVLLSASITAWYSSADHGSGVGPALLEISDDGSFSEPRSEGITQLEVHFDQAIDPNSFTAASFQVTGNDVNSLPIDLSGIGVNTSTKASNTVGVIRLDQALPNVARYLVRIVGVTDSNGDRLVGDQDRILTALKGDTSGDLHVDSADLSHIRDHRANPIDPTNQSQVRADVNQNGRVSSTDLSRSWGQRDKQAQAITDPAPISETLADFLISQMVPNQVFQTIWPGREGLLIQSTLADGQNGSVPARSWAYDNAVSIIALTMAGRGTQAAQIIDALMNTAPSNGDLAFSLGVIRPDADSDLIRTGANSWVGYAVNFHILARLTENPNALNEDLTLQGYLGFAENLAQAIMSRQIMDTNDLRHGLVTGGNATFIYDLDSNGNLRENFEEGERTWASVEHNIDAYFFLRDLAYLTGSIAYQESADLIRNALVNGLFNESIGQFNRGVDASGLDDHRALDTASWGALFLLASGENDLATTSLETTDQYRNTSNGVLGYKPSINERIYESTALQQYLLPNEPEKSWDDISFVWSEGSLGVAMAYLRTGQVQKAQQIVTSMLGTTMNVAGKGGIRYADQDLPFLFHDRPSTIGAAWALMTQLNLEGERLAQLFWSAQIELPGGIVRLGQIDPSLAATTTTYSGTVAVARLGDSNTNPQVTPNPSDRNTFQEQQTHDGSASSMDQNMITASAGPAVATLPVRKSDSDRQTTTRRRSRRRSNTPRLVTGLSRVTDASVEDQGNLNNFNF